MRLGPKQIELPRLDCPLEELPGVAGWVGVRNGNPGNITGLNTGLTDGAFFLTDEQGNRIVGSDQGSQLNEGIRGVNSGDSFIDREAKIRLPGSTHIFHLRITGNRGGQVIHADGTVAGLLKAPDGPRAHVRLIGWHDFGRDSTFNDRFDDGRRRYVPEPQPDEPQETRRPPVRGTIDTPWIVDEAGGDAVNPVESGDPIPGTL